MAALDNIKKEMASISHSALASLKKSNVEKRLLLSVVKEDFEMSENSIRILAWNANGLKNRLVELETFLNFHKVDIALISETHYTNRNCLKIRNYSIYHTPHPDGGAHGGSAVIITALY